MDDNKHISTTALAKELNMPAKELFTLLVDKKLIIREKDNWILTDLGRQIGGIVKSNSKIGTWIAWPPTITEHLNAKTANKQDNVKHLNATSLGEAFKVARGRVNPILSELGWVQKDRKGWILTKLGKSVGGRQLEHEKTGIPFVIWPDNITQNIRLIETFKELHGEVIHETNNIIQVGFREKFEAKHRTADGHYVRSKAEMLIDNWLYMSEIVHAYERKLPIEEDTYCDFYLPVGKVYIEYWGLEDDEKYLKRKQEKIGVYEKYAFSLIELNDTDIQNLDDILPKKLLKFGIQAY